MAAYWHLWRLIQAPLKQSPAYFIYKIPVQPVSSGSTWKENYSGMIQTRRTLVLHWIGHWATGITSQKLPESCKAGKIFWWNLLDPPGVPTLTCWGHLLWLCATLWQNTVTCQSYRCSTAFLHAPYIWDHSVNPFTMVVSSHQHWTSSSTTHSCYRQVANTGRMS